LPSRWGIRAIVASVVVVSLVSIDLSHAAWPRQAGKVRSKAAPPKCERSKFRLILDVGHTAEAPGARSARNVPEFEFNLRLAKLVETKLKAEGFAATSLLVTEGEARPSLQARRRGQRFEAGPRAVDPSRLGTGLSSRRLGI
jgi:N-acetylmuramoyl-L-alanine amidase